MMPMSRASEFFAIHGEFVSTNKPFGTEVDFVLLFCFLVLAKQTSNKQSHKLRKVAFSHTKARLIQFGFLPKDDQSTMDRRWYDDGQENGLNGDYYHHHDQHHHHGVGGGGGGGLQARREARSKQSQRGPSSLLSNPSRSPTSVTSLFNMPPPPPDDKDPHASSLYADKSLLSDWSSSHHSGRYYLGQQPRSRPRHEHDSFYRQDDSSFADAKPRATPGAQAMSNTFDAVARKMAAFDGGSERRIEIVPGITARLRGADETWQAIANDYYMPTQCFCCQTDICVIMDATYVLCPVCKVVSPLDNGVAAEQGGVGLGFTFDDLQKWQTEIILSQRR